MSEDWQVGDLAVCVGPSGDPLTPKAKCEGMKGRMLRVDGKVVNAGWRCRTGLIFDAFPSPHQTRAWDHRCFRKIHPDKHEQCEPEFVTLIKRVKIAASGTPTRRAETSSGSVGEADGGPVPERQTPND